MITLLEDTNLDYIAGGNIPVHALATIAPHAPEVALMLEDLFDDGGIGGPAPEIDPTDPVPGDGVVNPLP